MPPFGDEPGEKTARPLSFLSLRHVSPKRCAPGAVFHVFGPESAEPEVAGSVGSGSRIGTPSTRTKRPFENEEDETAFSQQRPKVTDGSTLPKSVFGNEGSEDDSGTSLPKKKGAANANPFGEEGSETDDQSLSSNDEHAFLVKQNTVFSFGWTSVSSFKKATFWRETLDDEKAKKPKRQYDNRKRAATAAYARKNSRGVFKRNGTDPARLQKLFAAPFCSCDFG